MQSRRAVLAAVPGLVLLATGCAKTGGVEGVRKALQKWLPQVRFDKVNLRGIDFEKADLTFVFDVSNPAPLKVALANFSYALDLEGQRFFDGQNPEGLSLDPEGTAKLRFPLTLRWDRVRDLLQATKGKDRLGFNLSGHMGFDTPAGIARLPYDAEGTVPALRRPRFELAGINLKSFQPAQDRAELGVQLKATNLGGSLISFKDADYTLHLAGERVATGLVQRLGDVAAEATERLVVPVDLRLSSVGASVVELLRNRGNIGARLGANLNVVTPFGEVPLSIDESGRVDLA